MGKVTMFHPPSGVTQDASRDAYQRVYREQGWELIEPAEPVVDADLAAARAEADAAGVSWHPNAKADTIRRKVADAQDDGIDPDDEA